MLTIGSFLEADLQSALSIREDFIGELDPAKFESRCLLGVQIVKLFERKALHFWQKEEYPDSRDKGEARPDESLFTRVISFT